MLQLMDEALPSNQYECIQAKEPKAIENATQANIEAIVDDKLHEDLSKIIQK